MSPSHGGDVASLPCALEAPVTGASVPPPPGRHAGCVGLADGHRPSRGPHATSHLRSHACLPDGHRAARGRPVRNRHRRRHRRDNTGAVVPDATVTPDQPRHRRGAASGPSDAQRQLRVLHRAHRHATWSPPRRPGFSIALADNVQVTVGARQRVDLTMARRAAHRDGRGAAPRRRSSRPTRASAARSITGEQTRALPLNGREYSALALLSPGVRPVGAQHRRLHAARGLVQRQRPALAPSTTSCIDGVDNNAYGTSNQGFSNQVMQPSPDAVAEFKVVTNNMSAEYGRCGRRRPSTSPTAAAPTGSAASAWEFFRDTEAERHRLLQAGRPARSRRSSATSSAACSAARSSGTARSSSPTTRASGRRASRRRVLDDPDAGAAAGHPARSTCAIR